MKKHIEMPRYYTTINELMKILKEYKAELGGNTRVVFGEPNHYACCDINEIFYTKVTGSYTDVLTYDPDDDDCPENAKPAICLYGNE